MSFAELLADYQKFDLTALEAATGAARVQGLLQQSELSPADYAALLTAAAATHLEPMAQAAQRLTRRHFGPNILLYTPLYLSNYCENRCLYCGFNQTSPVPRRQLSLVEVELEARSIAAAGFRHLLILTGESRHHASVAYLEDCVAILQKHFASINIEIYPLSTPEYRRLIAAGVDGLTLYQETYDPKLYATLHPQGPKRDYRWRLAAPQRAGQAGIRTINIGPLLGLTDWRREAFLTGIHAWYLQQTFPEIELSVSFPRLRPHGGDFQAPAPVSDRQLVQIILALRLFLPRVGITLSTREPAELRDHLIPLGVTKLSAGSITAVGGHSGPATEAGQFEIADHRSLSQVQAALRKIGYKPIFKDWHPLEVDR